MNFKFFYLDLAMNIYKNILINMHINVIIYALEYSYIT